MGALSPWHWAILAVVVIVFFGSKRLPDAARSLGKSMRIFKAEIKEIHGEGPELAPAIDGQSGSTAETQPAVEPRLPAVGG
jgi:sec-independent protein translocase protein TatA